MKKDLPFIAPNICLLLNFFCQVGKIKWIATKFTTANEAVLKIQENARFHKNEDMSCTSQHVW